MSDYRRPVDQYKPEFIPDLTETLADHARKLDTLTKDRKVTFDSGVTTSATEIRHSLGRTPTRIAVLPHGDARVWIVSKNNTRIVLQASASVDVTITLEG